MKVFGNTIGKEALKYIAVGSAGYVIDVGLFNIVAISQIYDYSTLGPIPAKIASFLAAITFTYLANGRWTFRHRTGRPEGLSRVARYAAVNIIGLAVTIAPLYVSRYVLGLDSLIADNIAANVLGVGLALVFRFFANRSFVFINER